MIYQGHYGDTHYYMIPADRLPILMPLETIGVPSAALALPDAVLRVLIEDAYVRNQSPGEHVQFQMIPIGNPVNLVGNMLGAIPVGIDDTVQQATGTVSRPLGTNDVYRPFGVGGPVYDKTTGAKTTDNVGIPTGSGTTVLRGQAAHAQAHTGGGDQGSANVASGAETTNTPVPSATKPDPFAKLRESLNFSPRSRRQQRGPTVTGR